MPATANPEVLSIATFEAASRILDRIAAEDRAWALTPPSRRRLLEGHRCLVVERRWGPAVVPLCDLTQADLDRVLA